MTIFLNSSRRASTALTAAILAYRTDPPMQIIRESLALCIDHVTPNDAKEFRAPLTEAAKDVQLPP